jgi:hypothetical protein
MSNQNIDPIANNALKNAISELPKPKAKEVQNLLQKLIEEANTPAPEPQYTAKEIDELESAPTVGIEFVYFASKHDKEGVEWSVDFQRTTSVCFEWKNMPYLVIQGPYTPVCFNLNRAFFQGTNEVIGFGLKKENRVFLHMDPSSFPSEGQQQDLLNIAGNGDPRSGQ